MRLGAKYIILFVPVLFLLSVFVHNISVFIHYAWLQSYSSIAIHSRPYVPDERTAFNQNSANSTAVVPRILHQTWKDEEVPMQWMTASAMCKRVYSDFQYMFWTNAKAREFIQREYPWFLEAYDSYPYDIQRADSSRYFFLEKFGGVYLDLDVGCSISIEPYLLQFPMVLPETRPVGISNDVMIAAPHHPFLQKVLRALPEWNHIYGSKFFTVFFSTGPAFLSYQVGEYLDEIKIATQLRGRTSHPIQRVSELFILGFDLYAKDEGSFFYHVEGNSWHAFDAKVINFVYDWYAVLAVICGPCCCCLVCIYRSFLPFALPARRAESRSRPLSSGSAGRSSVAELTISLAEIEKEQIFHYIRTNRMDAVRRAFDELDLDPNMTEPGTGNTLLHVCAKHGRQDLGRLCLRRGCRVNASNIRGLTALDYCDRMGHADMGKWIESEGGYRRSTRDCLVS